jgi:TetR/AcrR family transcriptional repressor of nem operon
MPYPAAHRAEVRKRIILSARKLFNQHGFDNVSLSQIMAGAGLTHGGFYSYFASKSDLYAEVLSCFFTDPQWKNNWKGVHIDSQAADFGAQIIHAYLSRQHFDDVANSCPMVALPSYVARSGPKAKRAFETVFRAMVDALHRTQRMQHAQPTSSGKRGHRGRRNAGSLSLSTAQAIAALCVGGMVVARTLQDRALADRLRDACKSVALRLGGWLPATNSAIRQRSSG